MTNPDLSRGTVVGGGGDDQKAKMEAIQEVALKLVNFEAYIMDLCLDAAGTLVEMKLMQKSAITHGPDPGPAVGDNPATAMLAMKLYEQVRKDLRDGVTDAPGEG